MTVSKAHTAAGGIVRSSLRRAAGRVCSLRSLLLGSAAHDFLGFMGKGALPDQIESYAAPSLQQVLDSTGPRVEYFLVQTGTFVIHQAG